MIATAQEFLALMRSGEPSDYKRFRFDTAPPEVWRELVNKYPLTNAEVTLNKTVPAEILHEIAKDPSVRVRSHVTMVRRISKETQEILAKDPDSSVRNMLANNAKVSDDLLSLLSADQEAFVRESAFSQIQKRKTQNK